MATKYETKVRKFGPMFKKDLNLTNVHVAGMFGNFGVETGKFKHMQEIQPVVAGSRGGYGWAQWTGPRRKEFEEWCRLNGQTPYTDEANYAFVVHELRNKENKALVQLRKTTTVKAAAETFMALYERPGVPHAATRIKYAEEAFEILENKRTPTTPEDKKVITNQTTTSKAGEATASGAVILTGAGYLVLNPTAHALAIVIGTAVVAGLAWLAVKWYKKRNAPNV